MDSTIHDLGQALARAGGRCYKRGDMSIVLVRHGETEGNAMRVLQQPDTPLNTRGLRQAASLAERLSGLGAVHIVCSDLLRARMTAEPIAQKLGLPVELSPLLQERNFGDLRGVSYGALAESPFAPDSSPPNGETWPAFHERVVEAFAMVCALRARLAGPLIVVTHGLVCRAMVERHTVWKDAGPLPDKFHNTSVTMLDEGEPFVVRLTNCFTHLGQADTDALDTTGRA